MTDIQAAITRLRQADEMTSIDCWSLIGHPDSDPQMLQDVVAVARAYARNQTLAHNALYTIQRWARCDGGDTLGEDRQQAMNDIANKAAEGLEE